MKELLNAGNIDIYVSETHRFGSDAVALADFTLPRVTRVRSGRGKVVCDLCAGCGVVGFMLNAGNGGSLPPVPPYEIHLAEIAGAAAELARDTINYHNLNNVIIHNGDIRDRKFLRGIGCETADIVTANPPYYKEGSGYTPKDAARLTARHEVGCALEDVTAAAAFLLRYGGILCMCIIPARLADAFCAMRAVGIEPKRLAFTEGNWLCLIEGKKGGKPGLVTE